MAPCLQGTIWVDAAVSPGGETVSVSVHDTGIGIPGEKLEDIFAPFAQAGGDWYCVAGADLGWVGVG